MTKRFFASLVVASSLALILFAITALLNGNSTQAGPVASTLEQAKQAKQEKPRTERPLGTWSDIAPYPTITVSYPCGFPSPCTPQPANVPARIKRAAAAAYPPNGRIYLLGGRHGLDGNEDFPLQYIWEYNPTNNTWLRKNALLDGALTRDRYVANMAVAVLTDTSGPRIYAVGGSSIDSVPTAVVRVYDPVADTTPTNLTSDPWPASPARIPGGYGVYNNKLYIFGGFSALGNGTVFSETWRFDPMAAAGAKWTQMGNLYLPRAYTVGAVVDGKLYAIGGNSWNNSTRQFTPVTTVEMLDLTQANPSWVSVAALPTARGDMGAWAYDSGTGYEISGKIMVAGGPFPTPDGNAYVYDPASNSWSTAPGMLYPTRNYGYAQLGGYLYALGGYDYSQGTPNGANFNQRYDAREGGTPTPTLTGTPPTSTPSRTGTSTPPATNTFTPVPTVCGAVLSEGFESGLGTFASQVATCVPGGCGWTPVPIPHSGANSAFAPDPDNISDQMLEQTAAVAIQPGAQMTFWHSYDIEDDLPTGCYDGAVLEYSTNGGSTWDDAGPMITTGAYDGVVSSSYGSPLSGRSAWCGVHSAFSQVTLNLSTLAGQNAKFRFRFASDDSVAAVGWWVDDVIIGGGVCPSVTAAPPTNTSTATVTTAPTNTPGTPEVTPTSCTLSFTDVPPNHTFYPFIRCLACRGIITGYPDSTFKPDNHVTRGQLAKIVSNSAGFTEPVSGQTFEDVTPGSTFYEYVERLASREVMGGYVCGVDPSEPCVSPENRPYFRPNAGATRGQLTKIVSNAAGFNDTIPDTQYQFTDVEPGSTFWLYVERLLLNRPGVMSGYVCGGPGEPCDSENRPYFRPNNSLTRGQTAKIVANTFFPDCQTPGR